MFSVSGIVVGAIYYGLVNTSCVSENCQRRVYIIVAICISCLVGLVLVSISVVICYNRCKGQRHQENTIFVNSTSQKSSRKEAYNVNPFQSGIWSSRYFQYEQWQKSYKILLSFDSESTKVTGSGSDEIGTFTIDGSFSMKTNRLGLTKTYQPNTGNPLENFGHQITIQLIWYSDSHQFQGKWYLNGSHEQGQFELKFDDQQQLSVYEKV